MSDALAGAEVVHLSFNPPFTAGSYNSLVAALVARDGEPRQAVISFWEGEAPAGLDERIVLVGPSTGQAVTSAALRLPERLRRIAFSGMGSADRIRYAKEVAALLTRHQPPVVVVWDDYKLAPFLRRADLRSALVLSQHGRVYHLPVETTRAIYRLDTLDAVITLTRASYEAGRDRTYAYEPLVFVRPNGVDTTRFAPTTDAGRREARASFGLPQDGSVVLSLARLAPSKGAHFLIHSWPRVLEQVPDALLWLVGGGDRGYLDTLERAAHRLGLADAVCFAGPVHRDDVARCHAAADLYVFPSVQDEGHPLSLLEAMSSGLACVAADGPVVRELHADAVELVAHPGLEDAFVAPVVRLLQDERARCELARRAREQVTTQFTLDQYLEEVSGFLGRLARSRGGR